MNIGNERAVTSVLFGRLPQIARSDTFEADGGCLSRRILNLALLVGCIATSPVHANLVTNGGFETGDFTGWTASVWQVSDLDPHSGLSAALNFCAGPPCTDPTSPNSAFLFQDLATIPGGIYNLSFWFNTGFFPTEGSELKVLWGSQQVADFVNVDTNDDYQHSVVTNLTATSASTRLKFLGRQDPAILFLDDIDVEAVLINAIPEPAPVGVTLAGLLMIGAAAGFLPGSTSTSL